jgi:hypothetical protein
VGGLRRTPSSARTRARRTHPQPGWASAARSTKAAAAAPLVARRRWRRSAAERFDPS